MAPAGISLVMRERDFLLTKSKTDCITSFISMKYFLSNLAAEKDIFFMFSKLLFVSEHYFAIT